METSGTQEHTVALSVADYRPRHRARLTFKEWTAEVVETAPIWALACVGVGLLLLILVCGALVVWLL